MTPYRVQLVCLGNICRSPMAESVLRRQADAAGLRRQLAIDSAGTGGWHVGDPADRRARAVLSQHGYALDHAAKQFQPAMFADRDLVVAMDAENLRDLRRLTPDKSTAGSVRLLREFEPDPDSLDVPDPYYGGREEFEGVLHTIEVACTGLLGHLNDAIRSR